MIDSNKRSHVVTDKNTESELAQAKEQLAPKTIEKSPAPGDEQAP